ncbi:hypothetical protein D3C85_1076840 [compost metagenome]
MKYVTMEQVRQLAYETGNSPQAVLTELFANGYQITEEAPQPRGNPLTSSKDALSLWKASKQKVTDELYKNDPIVRQLMDVENAYKEFGAQPHKSVVVRDEAGNITGTNKSMLTGATQKEQGELMAAIRAKYNQGE